MIINKTAISVFCFISSVCISCGSHSVVKSYANNEDRLKTHQPKIVYLFFEGEKSADGKDIIKLVDKKTSNGFFKNEEFGTAKDLTVSYYRITLYDRNNDVYKTSVIDNPFSPIFESYGETSMEKQIGNIKNPDFFYRYNDNGNLYKLEIHQVDNNKTNLIYTLKL